MTDSLASKDNTPNIYDGFITAKQYMGMSPPEQDSYVMGITDGLLAAPVVYGADYKAEAIKKCLSQKIFDRRHLSVKVLEYMKNTPDVWNKSAHLSVLSTLEELCPGIRP